MRLLFLIITTTFLLFQPLAVLSQDIHFSQFFASPLTLNPAHASDFDGDLRVVDNYRNQWFTLQEPYVSNAVSVDAPFYLRKQKFGAGVAVINDHSGDASLFVTKIYPSFSYHFNLGLHEISVGAQPGFTMKSFKSGNITFPDQYNKTSGQFDPGLPTSGSYDGNQISYFDLNAGITWGIKFEKWQPQASFAVFHLNRPNESFTGNGASLDIRYTAMLKSRVILSEKLILTPGFYYQEHGKASEMIAGTALSILTASGSKKISKFNTGLFYRGGINRNSDAAIVYGGMSFLNFDLGLSYDFNISGLHEATSYQGAIELSLIYTKLSQLHHKITVPCQRL